MSSAESNSKVMLTTVDNPYSPVTQFDDWYNFDVEHGYNTCGLLARLAQTSEMHTEEENDAIIDDAIERILNNVDFMGIYIKYIEQNN